MCVTCDTPFKLETISINEFTLWQTNFYQQVYPNTTFLWEKKFKQWWATIPQISAKQRTIYHLKPWTQKDQIVTQDKTRQDKTRQDKYFINVSPLDLQIKHTKKTTYIKNLQEPLLEELWETIVIYKI